MFWINKERNKEVQELLTEIFDDIILKVLSDSIKEDQVVFLKVSIEKIDFYTEEYSDDLLDVQKVWITQVIEIIESIEFELKNLVTIENIISDLTLKYLKMTMIDNSEVRLLDPDSQINNIFLIVLTKLCDNIPEKEKVKIWMIVNKLYLELRRFEQDVNYDVRTIEYVDELKVLYHSKVENEDWKNDFDDTMDLLDQNIKHHSWIKHLLAGFERKLEDSEIWENDN